MSDELEGMLESLDRTVKGERAPEQGEMYWNCIGDCEGKMIFPDDLRVDDSGNVIYECPDCGVGLP